MRGKASEAYAQQIVIPEVETIGQGAIQGLQACNQIVNMASANPGNIQLRMQARNCSLRLYQYQLCLVRESSAFPPNPNFAAKCANENLGN